MLELKDTEIMELKAKNEELKKHNEMLKKRVYAKTEFENQYKATKAENTDLTSKLQVSEKI